MSFRGRRQCLGLSVVTFVGIDHIMRRIIILLVPTLMFLGACEKEQGDEVMEQSSAIAIHQYSQLALGNYWVYERYRYDSLGNETILGSQDSLVVVGDTVANGQPFFVLQGTCDTPHGQPYRYYARDSADCLINLDGSLILPFGTGGGAVHGGSATSRYDHVEHIA